MRGSVLQAPWLDDVTFSSGLCERSDAEVPGAAIGGVLGSQTGPNVVADNGNRVRYFQYNDLGTVLVQTKADDSLEGLWLPDFFGNYNFVSYGQCPRASGSPARPELGLTGKMYDAAAGLYYFNARWYDPELGRWMSTSGMPKPVELEYAFNFENPTLYADASGRIGSIAAGAAAGFFRLGVPMAWRSLTNGGGEVPAGCDNPTQAMEYLACRLGAATAAGAAGGAVGKFFPGGKGPLIGFKSCGGGVSVPVYGSGGSSFLGAASGGGVGGIGGEIGLSLCKGICGCDQATKDTLFSNAMNHCKQVSKTGMELTQCMREAYHE